MGWIADFNTLSSSPQAPIQQSSVLILGPDRKVGHQSACKLDSCSYPFTALTPLRQATHSLTHSLTPSLPHSLTPSLPHSRTPSLPHSLTPSPPHLAHSLTHSLARSLNHTLTQSLTHSLTHRSKDFNRSTHRFTSTTRRFLPVRPEDGPGSGWTVP